MNQYTGIGNLTKDPTFTIGNDNKYCNFTVAVNNRNDDSTFIEVETFRNKAVACNNRLKKGSLVCVHGIPIVRAYIDKGGNPRAQLKIRANKVDFLARLKPKVDPNDEVDEIIKEIDKMLAPVLDDTTE